MNEDCIIRMDNVSYSSGGKDIIQDMDLCFRKGRNYAIIGPSGSGKTTALMLINGLISPTSGEVFFDGVPLREMEMPSYRSKVPLMFQEPLLVPGNGRQNIMLPFTLEANREKVPDEGTVISKMKECGLDENYLDKEISTFSGGEKQRLSLVRTLLLGAKVILLDEPTSALDSRSEKDVINVIKEFSREALMIYVTHSQQLIEAADEIIVIKEGSIATITEEMDTAKLQELMELE